MPKTTSEVQMASDHIQWFRNSAPYINTHRDKTFVIMFGGEAVNHSNFSHLLHDFALLHSLGIKLVLVHGARPQIEERLTKLGLDASKPTTHNGIRITPQEAIPAILEVTGTIKGQIEAQLSIGLVNSPIHSSRISTVTGNFVTAKPYGIKKDIDYQRTGEVRAIDVDAIKANLAHNHIVLLGSVAYSATGEAFNLLSEDVALKTAIALNADKLIFLSHEDGVNEQGRLLHEMIPNEVDRFLRDKDASLEIYSFLKCASQACRQDVHRTHIISYAKDGALLEELFTRDGSGTLISHDPYEEVRRAHIDDVVGITELLRPLQEQNSLVKQPLKRLEQEIDLYSVIERDGMILGCGALYPLDTDATEVASFAIHPDYNNGNRGADFLAFLEQQARGQGCHELFTVTTIATPLATQWFIEQGFEEVEASTLDRSKPTLNNTSYNNSNITDNRSNIINETNTDLKILKKRL